MKNKTSKGNNNHKCQEYKTRRKNHNLLRPQNLNKSEHLEMKIKYKPIFQLMCTKWDASLSLFFVSIFFMDVLNNCPIT